MLLYSWPIGAEYRLYQYYVSSPSPSPLQREGAVLVISALDPASYVAFHGGSHHTRVDMLRTWICPGHTGKKAYCPSPYRRVLQQRREVPALPGPPPIARGGAGSR